MPIYEYRCPKCGDFDQMQKITEEPLKKCPTCKNKVTKLISNPAFHLKGAGWYITDYGRKGGGEGKSGEGKSSDSGGADSKSEDSSASSDSKADKKADKKEKKADKKGTSASAAA
jgi:putative FmdB family regulatory protein